MELEITSKMIESVEELKSFRALLQAANLPHEDLQLEGNILLGYYEDGKLVGTGAIESYGRYGLLRSLSVQDASRGRLLGSKITADLLQAAKKRGMVAVYLLTETAKLFFKRKGFKEIKRDQAPKEVQASSEFVGVCPESAVCMEYMLQAI